MDNNTMIRVSDVTMRFRMNNDKILSLKEFVTTALRGKLQYSTFTALEHVSFEVQKGETIGLYVCLLPSVRPFRRRQGRREGHVPAPVPACGGLLRHLLLCGYHSHQYGRG